MSWFQSFINIPFPNYIVFFFRLCISDTWWLLDRWFFLKLWWFIFKIRWLWWTVRLSSININISTIIRVNITGDTLVNQRWVVTIWKKDDSKTLFKIISTAFAFESCKTTFRNMKMLITITQLGLIKKHLLCNLLQLHR